METALANFTLGANKELCDMAIGGFMGAGALGLWVAKIIGMFVLPYIIIKSLKIVLDHRKAVIEAKLKYEKQKTNRH
jgi:hypothetical protein